MLRLVEAGVTSDVTTALKYVADVDIAPGQLLFIESPFLKIDYAVDEATLAKDLESQLKTKHPAERTSFRKSLIMYQKSGSLAQMCRLTSIPLHQSKDQVWDLTYHRYSEVIASSRTVESKLGAIYLKLGSCGHNCSPNTIVNILPDQRMTLYATRQILRGDEISYTWLENLAQNCKERNGEYMAKFGTRCPCSVCKRGAMDPIYQSIDDLLRCQITIDCVQIMTLLESKRKALDCLNCIDRLVGLLELSYRDNFCSILLLRKLHVHAAKLHKVCSHCSH
jgi:hypothetical protein